MKTAFLAAFFLSALSLAGDQSAGAGQPIEEWPQARWGMTQPQVLKAFAGAVRELPSPQSSPEFTGRLGTIGIDDVVVGGVELQALFLFDHAGKLDGIRLTSPDSTSPTDEQFRKIEDSLTRKYREPLRSTDKNRFLSVWMLSRSVIELDYTRPASLTVSFDNKSRQTPETIARGLTVVHGKHVLAGPLVLPAWLAPFPHQDDKNESATPDRVQMSYDTDAAYAVVVGHYESILRRAARSGITFTEGGSAHGAIFEISKTNANMVCTVEVIPAANTQVIVECSNTHTPEIAPTLSRTTQQAPPRAQTPTAAPSSNRDWAVVSVDSRITEANNVWSRFAWKLVLRNDTAEPHVFQGTIEFQDKDGFIVDTSNAYNMLVPGRSEEDFTGFALIKAEVVASVARTVAKVHRTR